MSLNVNVMVSIFQEKRKLTKMDSQNLPPEELQHFSDEYLQAVQKMPRELQPMATNDFTETSDGYIIPKAKWVELELRRSLDVKDYRPQEGSVIYASPFGKIQLVDVYFNTDDSSYYAHAAHKAIQTVKNRVNADLDKALWEIFFHHPYMWGIDRFRSFVENEWVKYLPAESDFINVLRVMGFNDDNSKTFHKLSIGVE